MSAASALYALPGAVCTVCVSEVPSAFEACEWGAGGGRGQFLKYRPICNAFNREPAAGGNLPPCQATLLLCWSPPQDAISGVMYHLFQANANTLLICAALLPNQVSLPLLRV